MIRNSFNYPEECPLLSFVRIINTLYSIYLLANTYGVMKYIPRPCKNYFKYAQYLDRQKLKRNPRYLRHVRMAVKVRVLYFEEVLINIYCFKEQIFLMECKYMHLFYILFLLRKELTANIITSRKPVLDYINTIIFEYLASPHHKQVRKSGYLIMPVILIKNDFQLKRQLLQIISA